MIGPIAGLQQTSSYKVVLPFYLYAGISYLIATVLLFLHSDAGQSHYFHPHTLAITHTMALGWGTMIIMGASHQLLPVIIEGKLDSNPMAYLSFVFTALGIPVLVYSFYRFNTGWLMQLGAALVNFGVFCYVMNVVTSIIQSKKYEIHAWYMGAASVWLFCTTFVGMLLVFNFSKPLLPSDSVEYLSLHAHLGLIGWFLLLVIGVASRLVPLFLISKYTNNQLLKVIFVLINVSLLSVVVFQLMRFSTYYYYISLILALVGILLFVVFVYKAYKVRIRKGIDEQMKISILAVGQMLLPLLVLLGVLLLMPTGEKPYLSLLYGFSIFFGWLTAIILGMTFKTLPFIVWNKVYHDRAHGNKTPAPKALFSEPLFKWMSIAYLLGFVLFSIGIVTNQSLLLKSGAAALLLSAILYVANTTKVFLHKAQQG